MPKYSDKQKKTIDRVYRTLKKAGYDDHAIAGILGNAHTESLFDPDSVGPSHYGLFLNDNNIRAAVVSRYGDYSLDSLLKYIMDWNDRADWIRKGDYSAYTAMNAGKFKKTGYKNAQEASNAWMKLYERPVIMKDGKVVGYQSHDQRIRNSIDALNYINSVYNTGDADSSFFPVDWDLVNKPQLNLPTLPKENPVPFENKPYLFGNHLIQPLAQQNVWNNFNNSAITYEDEPGSAFKLQLRLPSLNELMAMNSPQEQLKLLISAMIHIPSIQPVTNMLRV